MKPIFYIILSTLTCLISFQVYALVRPAPDTLLTEQMLDTTADVPEDMRSKSKQAAPARMKNLTANIVRRNLFNVEVDSKTQGRPADPKPVDTRPLEKTSLKLTLWGTVTGEKQEDGWAVIEDLTKRQQDLYRVNDKVQGGTINEILRNKIILTVNGERQILEVSEDAFTGKPTRSRPSRTKSPKRSLASKNKNPGLPQDPMEDAGDPPPVKQATDFKSRAYFRNGEAAGVMVYGIRSNSTAKTIGLRNGDVVQAVDDVDIASPQDFESIADSIDGESDITLSVLRRGKPKEVVYDAEKKSFSINDVEE